MRTTRASPGAGAGNITSQPRFVSASDYHLASNSPCLETGLNAGAPGPTDLDGRRRIGNGIVDMGAYEYLNYPFRYVAPGQNPVYPYIAWTNAASTIQDAADSTVSGTVVWVSNGVYSTGTRATPAFTTSNRVVITNAITVLSVNGPEVTTIRGTSGVRCVYISAGSLAGFTLTAGNSTPPSNSIYQQDYQGGGAYALGGTISNCVIVDNAARYGGGVAYGTIFHCLIASNFATYGGGAAFGTLSFCTLADNFSSHGGGAYSGTLYTCSLKSNTGGIQGGGAWACMLRNCLITSNHSAWAGGAHASTLLNCTVADNTRGYNFAICAGCYDCAISNSIVWHNYIDSTGTEDNYGGSFVGSFTFRDSCTTPAPGGSGNITANPLFVDTSSGNFRLATNSPCIDAGNTASAAGLAADLDGNARVQRGAVDMGAYEFQPLTNYLAWSYQIVGTETAPDQFGAGDGVPNLLRYATGSDPNIPDQFSLLAAGLTTNGLFETLFRRNTNASDVTLILERSTALASGVWTGIATNRNGSWGGLTNVLETPGAPATVSVRETTPANDGRFMRLRVTQP